MQTANSYIADQRLGFAEPTPGVELYFCPPHPKTTEMLERHLPKDQTEPLSSVVNGLIGVVVWRRAHVTTISPRLSSHHKHSTSTKKHSSSRRQHQNVSNPKSSTYSKTQPDEPIDDVPPGFGPGSARDEDDLPEFDFSRSKSQKSILALPPPPSRPVQQMRELIFKYGKGDDAKKPPTGIQSWNDDDDDIPEWKPDHNNQPIPQPQQPQQLPPPPQLPPLPQPHTNYQQPTIHQQQQQPFFVNQNIMQPQQLMPMPVTLSMPQMNFMQVQPNMNPNMNINPGWQQGTPLWAPPPQMQPCHVNFIGQPSGGNNGQFYGVPVQSGMMGWRPDVPRNNGV